MPQNFEQSIGKSYSDMNFKDLSQHPLYENLLKDRESISAQTANRLTDPALSNRGGGHWSDKNGAWEYKVSRPLSAKTIGKNYAGDFALTKSDVAKIRSGKITPEITQKIRDDLGRLDYDPAYRQTIKGKIDFSKDKAVITIFRDADATTIPHELGHYFRRTLDDVEIKEAEQAFGVKGGVWDAAAEERFANGFTKYLSTGDAPTPTLKAVFEKFKVWIRKTWEDIFADADKDFKLKDDQKLFFKAILGDKQAAKKLFGNGDKEALGVRLNSDGMLEDSDGNVLFQAWGKDKEIDKLLGIPQELTSFGRNFSKFKNDPKGAIDHLIKVKNGQVRGALYHNELGEIDIVWGKVIDPEKHTGYGLAHIIDKHGEDVARRLDDIIMGGKVIERKGNRVVLKNNDDLGIVSLEWNKKDKKWVISAYEPEKQISTDASTMAGKSDNLSPRANITIQPKNLKENKLSKQEWEANLKEWHKDSHPLTKNEDGSPKVFYHETGATKQFKIFNTVDSPAWFTTNKGYAEAFTNNKKLFEVYLNIKNPIFVGDIDRWRGQVMLMLH